MYSADEIYPDEITSVPDGDDGSDLEDDEGTEE